jgi:hypothetical protein
MDPRFQALLDEQIAARFAGLTGSDARLTLRISDRLMNDAIAQALVPGGAVRSVVTHALNDNRLDAIVTLARPAFVPPLHLHVAIERGPTLPQDPTLVLRIGGGAGGLLKLVGPLLAGAVSLPPGVRLEKDAMLVDVRALLAARGLTAVLDYVRDLQITTEESAVLVHIDARVP